MEVADVQASEIHALLTPSFSHTTGACNHEATCVDTALTQRSLNPAPALGLQTNVEEPG